MKNCTLSLLVCFTTASLFAQDVRLNDSVIFINNAPVAMYAKTLNKSAPRYNMEVYSFDDYVLIKAEVIKFNSPAVELRPFYYYELTFPPTADTFAIYIEDEAFPLVLAKIIRDYNLIDKNKLNKKNVSKFIAQYSGGPALVAKIKSFVDYLNETRHLNEQEKRDRTKPVTIINDRIIIQDGVKIGLIAVYQNYNPTNRPTDIFYDKSNYGIPFTVIEDKTISTSSETQIVMANGRKVDNLQYYSSWNGENPAKKTDDPKLISERSLYQVSRAAYEKISTTTDGLLKRVCYLIENYAL
jgi:hypothetical protein